MELDFIQWLLLFVLITVSGFVQSSLGFGYALVAMAFLPLLIGVKTANVVVSFGALAPIVLASWAYRKEIPWRTLKRSLMGAICGLPLGILVLQFAIEDYLLRGTGVVILLLALDGLFSKRKPIEELALSDRKNRGEGIAGLCSGVLAGAVSIGGPPIVIFASRQPWNPAQFKAYVTGFLLLLSFLKLAGLILFTRLVTPEILQLGALAMPAGLIGGQLGVWATDQINATLFRRLTLAMLIVIAVLMIVRGASG